MSRYIRQARARWATIVAVSFALVTPAESAAQMTEAEVVDVVGQFLEAIGSRDTATYRTLVLPEVQNLIVVPEADSVAYFWRPTEESIRQLGGPGPTFLERMWEPKVWVSDPIAAVWVPYDLYRDGEFSHCGIDAFHLVRTSNGWRIAAIMYTVVRPQSRCPASPLGSP